MDALAEFVIFPSRCGLPTAVHVPSRTLIHSRVDPQREAEEIVGAEDLPPAALTILFGGGLGYLAEAIVSVRGPDHNVLVLEPDSALHALGRRHRAGTPYFTSPNIQTVLIPTGAALLSRCRDVPGDAAVIISPYALRLASRDRHPLSGYLQILRAERASRYVYESLVSAHLGASSAILSTLPKAVSVRLPDQRPVIVAGAGPSLDACAAHLREHRGQCVMVAASGAVPALLANGLEPDWVIALEAREAILDDLLDLPASSNVIVFPATHPAVYSTNPSRLFCGGGCGDEGLETRGGTSVIPALDFAMRVSGSDVVMVGVDLGNQRGTYARHAKRETDVALPDAPRVINARPISGRCIYHVLEAGQPLSGTRLAKPADLPTILEHHIIRKT
jgi:hypothetical protein